MLIRRLFAYLLPALWLTGCGHSLPSLPGFNSAAWRHDAYACQDQRRGQLPAIEQHREQLYGTRTDDIDGLFGHPDEEELNEQTERTYYYYLEPGLQCGPRHPRSAAPKLVFHFGSTGIVTEVRYERPPAS